MTNRSGSRSKAGDPEERPLARYKSMRDFKVTPEPSGKKSRGQREQAQALPFVVQKHAATRLHYDFRLGWNGVLKSWAVAKGPSYYPGDKRLAVQVEDHPWDYRDFEGTIPKGQYGGGAVMVWDMGSWTPIGDVDQGLKDGHLKFELHGEKLLGKWVLVRMNGHSTRQGKQNWLLIKEHDEFARESSAQPITEQAPNSAASGRTMAEIAAANGHVWNSADGNKKTAMKAASAFAGGSAVDAKPSSKSDAGRILKLTRMPRERFPGFIPPQLAQVTTTAPSGTDWDHELKLDGYRIQIQIRSQPHSKRNVQLLTRTGLDWSDRMPDIRDAASRMNVMSAILDGEAVVLNERGVSNFADLQAAFQGERHKYITYFAFDLLHLDGRNLRALPLSERRKILIELLGKNLTETPLRLSEAVAGDGKEIFEKACELGAEGLISKRLSAPYSSGRSGAWLKLKCRLEQEFVIGGFTLPSKGTVGVGALLLGYYNGKKLRYAGRAGTGFTQATHRSLRARMDRLTTTTSPFADVPREQQHGAHWLKPELVAQIMFSTWTHDNIVRQAAFKGLREDKPAREVVRETAGSRDAERTDPPKVRRNITLKSSGNSKEEICVTKLEITHPGKILDIESGMTKGALAEYYAAVAGHLLPHIADRPLSVVRCPAGTNKPCFFQKHVGSGVPQGVKSVAIQSLTDGKSEDYLTVNSSEGLIGLAQMGVLEIHPWGSRIDSLGKPDRIVFDLDPDTAIGWKTLAETAQALRVKLKKLQLISYLKSTGGKGLHVVVPIRPDYEWAEVKNFAHDLVLEMERANPELYVTKMTKALRKNRIYLDYLRNDREATSIAPYSPRARQGAPVAMPLEWKELNAAKAPVFHVSDFSKWKARLRNDPWRKLPEVEQRLSIRSEQGTAESKNHS